MARKTRKMPNVDWWKKTPCWASVAREEGLRTVRHRVAADTWGEEEDAMEEDEGEREGVVRVGAW